MRMRNVTLIILSILLFGCNKKAEDSQFLTPNPSLLTNLDYANNFNIEHLENYTTLSILSPWEEDKVLYTYYLVKNDTIQTPKDGVKIKVPVDKIAVRG